MIIRYHHLMCIPRYTGKGYSEDFCENMEKIKNEIAESHYELTDKCDDICKHCPNNSGGICLDEDKVKRYDDKVKAALKNKQPLLPERICSDCKWFYICKDIEC